MTNPSGIPITAVAASRTKREKEIIFGLFGCYCLLVLVASWWPFRFQLHPLPTSSVEWPPFELLSPKYWKDGKRDLLKVVTFVPIGIFLALLSGSQRRNIRFVWHTIVFSTCLSLLIQMGWFFLPGRLISATNIVMNVAGGLAGTIPIFFRIFPRKALATLIMLYGSCFLTAATWPWSFSLGPNSLSGIMRRIEWLPFNGYFLRMWVLKEAALNSLMMVPLGLLAASYIFRSEGTRKQAVANAVVVGCACSFIVEFVQYFLPVRTPSFGDITVNTVGALLGGLVACYLENWHVNHGPILKKHDRSIELR